MNRRVLLKCVAFWALVGSPGVRAEAAALRRQLRFTLTITNPMQRALGRQVVWAYLPLGEAPCQGLAQVEVSVPHRLLRDSLGHTILELTEEALPGLATRVVALRVDVDMRGDPKAWPLPDAERWLGAERYIETDHPDIRALAGKLRAGRPWQTARAIYDWVAANIEYAGYVAEDRGALDALTRRRGDCTEYAYLVAALARASGIPARVVGGYVVTGNAVPKPLEYHNWAELYLDGTWRLVDAQKGNWLSPADDYVSFRLYREALDNPLGQAHRFRVSGEASVSF